MPSSNLIPTPIVNKNGVSTTVYKAVDKPSFTAASKIPAPAQVSVRDTPSTIVMKRLRNTMADPFVTTPSEITSNHIERIFDGYPEETQEYIAGVLKRDQDDDTFLDRAVISMLNKRCSPEEIEDALFVYEGLPDSWDAITVASDWAEDGFGVDFYLIQIINGARSYGTEVYSFGTDDKSLRHYDESTQRQALSLIALCYEMTMDESLRKGLDSTDTSLYINDTSTVRHIVSNPHLVQETVDSFLEYGRVSWDAVVEMRESASAPLREGAI